MKLPTPPSPTPKKSPPQRHQLSNGFSLVETLISLGLSSLVLILTFSLFASLLKSQRKAHIINLVQSSANTIANRLSQDIRWGKIENTNPLTIQNEGGQIVYQLNLHHQLTRTKNDAPPEILHPDQVITQSFDTSDQSTNPDTNQVLLKISFVLTGQLPQDQLLVNQQDLLLATRTTNYQLEVTNND